MLDVHPPHETIHGWRDFLLHLLTITVGLLIALSLEGCVEWQHHRHLVHQAEVTLDAEIRENAAGLKEESNLLHKQQESLKHDVLVLKTFLKSGKPPAHDSVEISFNIKIFKSVAWKTAQSTGALTYMPYSVAGEYSEIYNTQDELYVAQQQAARDAIVSLGPFVTADGSDPDPTSGEAAAVKAHLETLQGQLILVSALVDALDQNYRKFLAAHP